MRLGDVIAGSEAEVKAPGSASVRICDITDASRTALPGSLFIARRGLTVDGRAFVADAVAAGAVAVLTDDPSLAAPGAQVVYAQDLPRAAAVMAETFYGKPSQRLRLIGVTGTNGKTTTTWLIRAMLRRLGIGCGLMGTIEVDDGGCVGAASLTTPPATEISRTLGCMVDNGLAACAMEVSSHALVQGRAAGLRFDSAVFTNLSGDHLDYHGDLDSYAGAKAMLFDGLGGDGLAIVNADDSVSERMARDCAADVLWCSLEGGAEHRCRGADIGGTAAIHALTRTGFEATLRGPWGQIEAQVGLVGRHNVMNTLQALCAAWRVAPDASAEDLAVALAALRAPPGRLEPASGPEDDITVLVDYAHTDDALDKALLAARDLTPPGAQLWVVFGCGGDRDRTKRPRMGAVAERLADRVVVTSDNPRTESPKAIVEEIIAGMIGRDFEVQVDRERAIGHAVLAARRADVVVIAGKGHEDYQILPDGDGGTYKRHFDDREVAREALRVRAQARAVTS